MKKFILLLCLVGCCEVRGEGFAERVKIAHQEKLDNMRKDRFVRDNHTYIIFYTGTNDYANCVVHDPDCKCKTP